MCVSVCVCVHGSPTQLSHRLQWEVRGGRNILQVKQYLSFTGCWLMATSRVRGGGRKLAFPEKSAEEEETIRFQESLPLLKEPVITLDLTDLLLHLGGLVRRRSGQDARVAEAGPEEGEQHKQEEDPPDSRYAAGQVLDQEGTAGTQTEAGTLLLSRVISKLLIDYKALVRRGTGHVTGRGHPGDPG